MELWQTWCMRRTENPENVVRLHEAPRCELAEILEAPPWVGEGGNNDIRITPENMWWKSLIRVHAEVAKW